MTLTQAGAQNLVTLRVVPQLDPQLLLTLLVAFLFVNLIVIGALTRTTRGRQRVQELKDQHWREVLMRRFTEMDENSK